MNQKYVDPARWFDAVGECRDCHKPAHGQVRGPRNESMGNYCTRCGNARVNKAHKAQEKAQVSVSFSPNFDERNGIT